VTETIALNEVIATILARRSVRFGFDASPVSRDDLAAIVACGLAAPSSKNARPWRLHVITNRAILDTLARAAETADHLNAYVPHDPLTGQPYPHWQSTVLESAAVLREAPCAIALENRGVFSRGTSTMSSISSEKLASSLTAFGLESMGLGTALENMWLAANSLGLAVAFLGDMAIASDAARTVLGIEGDLAGMLVLGHSTVPAVPKREPPASTQTDTPVVWH